MAAGPARARWCVAACLVFVGCAELTGDHFMPHRTFAETYRTANVVAIIPSVQVWEHIGTRNIVRDDWSLEGFGNVTRALQAEFEARGLAVVWVERRPDTALYVESVSEASRSLLPVLERTPLERIGMTKEFSVGNAGALLHAYGGDLLVVVLASSVVADAGAELGLTLLTLGLHTEEPTTLSVRIVVADSMGRVVCFGMADGEDASLLSPREAIRAIGKALEEIPRKKR